MRQTSEQRVCKQLLEALLFERIERFSEHPRQDGSATFRFIRPPYELTINGRRGAFDRIWLELSTGVLTKNNQVQPMTLAQIIACFQIKDSLRQELEQTVALDESCPVPIVARTQMTYSALEQALIEGHPYHPCFKSRIGFSSADHWRYGPESGQRFRLRFVALPATTVHMTQMNGVMEQAFGQATLECLNALLIRATNDSADYQIVPVHPWQWRCVGVDVLDSGGIDLGESGPLFQATQSIRTVFQPGVPGAPHIKLPLDLIQTSARRTFDVPSIVAAPVLSDWLIRRAEKLPVTLLREFASQVVETKDGKLSGRIGCLYRDNVLTNVTVEETVIPFTALALNEANGELFLDPWFKKYGMEQWVKQFLTVYLQPVFRLVAEEGLALEAHAQNSLLVLKDGWPTRLILRDFHDSVEYVGKFVRHPEEIPDFKTIHPAFNSPVGTYYEMKDVEALRELVSDTVFVFHLTELSHQLEDKYALKETTFFKWAAAVLDRLELSPDRFATLGFGEPTMYTESLFARKFETGQCRHLVCNTLYTRTQKGSETHVIH